MTNFKEEYSATAELERSEKLLQEYREVIRELLLLL